ncbi:MAG: 4a-hydroxytetrahydrobiopterin dehydratase [Pseudomonadota bacterium]|nr:MAG: 4a-hydroxytetrahydrobiopterin dehydratase [Pseudomonadota bacterium]
MDLRAKRCVPCEGGTPPMTEEEQRALLPQVPGWKVEAGRLVKTFVFESFPQAIAFVNRMADLAEEEGHHPDFCVHYREVKVSLWTFAIGGLSENDFILAAKIDGLLA